MEFCEALPERAGVVAIPAQAFHDSDAGRHLVRWAFCKERNVIEDGLRRLARGASLREVIRRLAARDRGGRCHRSCRRTTHRRHR